MYRPLDWFLAPQVGAKRTNRPGISTTDRGFPRARFRSRGGSFSSRARYYSGYTPPRGRGRAFRWADAEAPQVWRRGRTLDLHALHLTHCLHWKERTGENRADNYEQPGLAAAVIDRPAVTLLAFLVQTRNSGENTDWTKLVHSKLGLPVSALNHSRG